MHNRLGKI